MLIVFDWDGTLCDSTARIAEAMQSAARSLDYPVPAVAAVREVIGLGLPEAMAQLFPELGQVEHDRMRRQYSATYVELDREPAGLFPGARAVLNALRRDGHQLAVATGKGRRGLDRVLGGLGLADFFDATRCADETASKPDPRMLLELLEELGGSATSAVMVGDSEYDLLMAAAAGMPTVGVSYGVHSAARLRARGPLAIIDDIRELPAALGLSSQWVQPDTAQHGAEADQW